jgi:hypothetical protein
MQSDQFVSTTTMGRVSRGFRFLHKYSGLIDARMFQRLKDHAAQGHLQLRSQPIMLSA